jgi:hypothetical protein
MRLVRALMVTIIVALPTIAQSAAARKPWQWTDAERIAARVNPRAAHERVVRTAASWKLDSSSAETSASAKEPFDDIDGRYTPELFLPYELFETMMHMELADDPVTREASQAAVEAERKAAGLPDDFWTRLEPLCSAYLADWNGISDLLKPGFDPADSRFLSQIKALEKARCRDRAMALDAARHELGEPLEIFLYTAMTKGHFITVLSQPDAKQMHFQNGGCR